MRGSGFKLKESISRPGIRGGKTVELIAQRGCRCPLPGSIQGQVRQGSDQPHPVEGKVSGEQK